MNKRDFIRQAGGALIGASLLSPLAAAAQDPRVTRQLSDYLNGIGTMQGTFVQIAPDGRVAEGDFYLRRPGRMRFEYKPPQVVTVVADGFWVATINSKLKTLDRVPLSSVPELNILLKENVDLAREGAIRSVEHGPGVYRVTAVNPSRPNQGKAVLIFSQNPIELQQWVVTDASGRSSTFTMRNVERGKRINPAKFVIKDPRNLFND